MTSQLAWSSTAFTTAPVSRAHRLSRRLVSVQPVAATRRRVPTRSVGRAFRRRSRTRPSRARSTVRADGVGSTTTIRAWVASSSSTLAVPMLPPPTTSTFWPARRHEST
ncbi:MAG: hypothetical protein AAGA59_11860 [Actinomycetota bacterium]